MRCLVVPTLMAPARMDVPLMPSVMSRTSTSAIWSGLSW